MENKINPNEELTIFDKEKIISMNNLIQNTNDRYIFKKLAMN